MELGDRIISIVEIQAISVRPGFFWSKLKIETSQSPNLILGGLTKKAASKFAATLRVACAASASARLEQLLVIAAARKAAWQCLLEQPQWLATSQVKQFIAESQARRSEAAIDQVLSHSFMAEALDRLPEARAEDLRYLHGTGLLDDAERRNKAFLAQELERYGSFFDSVERNPLTDEQRHAVVTFEDNVMTVAAAGSGKTSVMVAKAGYAVTAGLYELRDILLLAFNRKAAAELAERVSERLGSLICDVDQIRVATFHSLGLSIIAQATGQVPDVAPWVESGTELTELAKIVSELQGDAKFANNWHVFKTVFARSLPAFGSFEVPEAWDPETGQRGFKTIRGEVVKSQEERMICDWLADKGIGYMYERPYEYDTATAEHRQYMPDFFYPSANVYHEHFALDEDGKPPKHFAGYADGVRWKRDLHVECGTALIETTSFGIRNENGFERLEGDLNAHGVKFGEIPLTDNQLERLSDDGGLLRVFRTFLSHVKSNHLSMADLRQRARSKPSQHPHRDTLFLDIFERLWAEWEQRLQAGGYVDFDDMLGQAAGYLSQKRCTSPYKLILADEFQDTSRARGLLLRELSRASDARLFVVGDDWQAINRFAGADISLMRDFEKFFGDSTVVKLTKTFRSPAELNDLAARFVMSNPYQIKKSVLSTNKRATPSVICFKLDEFDAQEGLLASHLRKLADKRRSLEAPDRVTAYVLGRNNFHQPIELPHLREEVADVVDLQFSTVHAAKGLEADYIFLVHVIEDTYGFPNKIEDDSMLWIAMPDGEDFPYAEERRLFYVALTRAKRLVTIYTDKHRRSEFIAELEKMGGVMEVRAAGDAEKSLRDCPKCHHGVLTIKKGRYGQFLSCARFPKCDYTESLGNRRSSLG